MVGRQTLDLSIYVRIVVRQHESSDMKHRRKVLSIAQLGQPVVRRKTKRVADVTAKEIQSLIDDMIATVGKVEGVGIAAPQVYKSLRICIVASYPNSRYPHAPKMKPTAIINPEVMSFGRERVKDWEGCLSIPGIRARIPRYTAVTVSFITRQGKKVKKTFKGFLARIFQHELDHLEGTVILDRVESNKEIITEKEFQRLAKSRKQ